MRVTTGHDDAPAALTRVWGKEVRRARKKLRLSLRGLAPLLGVDYRTVWRWEHNQNTPPAAILQRLANLSGLTLGLQFTPEGEPNGTD